MDLLTVCPLSLSDDLTWCLLCLSLPGDLTDGPGGAKEYQTVGYPSSLRACPGYRPTMSDAASVSLPRSSQGAPRLGYASM